MHISIILNNVQYEIEDTEEVCTKILLDANFASLYCMGAEQETNLGDSEIAVPPEAEAEIRPPDISTEVIEEPLSQATALITSPLQVDGGNTKGPSWEHKNVLLFLNECIKYKADFRNPKIRRRQIFQKIQEAMVAKAGVSFTPTALDIKLKNLKLRYHNILENNKKTSTGRGRMPWPYFDLVGEVFEGEVRVKDSPTISSLNPSSAANNLDNCPGTSNTSAELHTEAPRSRKSAAFKEKLLNIEERKLAIAEEILIELKELRKLRREAIDKENTQRNSED